MVALKFNSLCLAALATTLIPTVHAAAFPVAEFQTDELLNNPDISITNDRSSQDSLLTVDKRSSKSGSTINSDSLSDFIIIFKQGTSLKKRNLHHEWLDSILSKTHDFVANIAGNEKETNRIENNIRGYLNNTHIQGYYGSFRGSVIEAIRKSEDVAVVEKDSNDSINDFVYLQYNAPWGLDRISHKTYTGNGNDAGTYLFGSSGGSNTTIYILDSGVRADHREFNGRVRWGGNFVDNEETDVVGHGSHVAGIAAGYAVGVAKFANIVSVKVIDANRLAPISRIVQGLAWIIEDHNENPGQRSVINYSAVGSISDARSYAINQAIQAGIMLVTAAGNSQDNACNYGPADMAIEDGVISVGALNYTNTPADFSNFGSCINVYAPGVSILSAGNDTITSYKYMSGTSMASPFVAGLASYFWSSNSSYSLGEVKNLIINYNQNQIQGVPSGTGNRIAYNLL